MFDWVDLNGDGITDRCEEYIAFRIWEDMNGIREETECGEIREMLDQQEQV